MHEIFVRQVGLFTKINSAIHFQGRNFILEWRIEEHKEKKKNVGMSSANGPQK